MDHCSLVDVDVDVDVVRMKWYGMAGMTGSAGMAVYLPYSNRTHRCEGYGGCGSLSWLWCLCIYKCVYPLRERGRTVEWCEDRMEICWICDLGPFRASIDQLST